MSSTITLAELQTSHDYWVDGFNEKQKSIDELCVQTAERLGQMDHQLWKEGAEVGYEERAALLVEKNCLEDILKHFIGFVDLEYVVGHDLSPESIERNKTREARN